MPPTSTESKWPVNGSPRRRGLARSVRSHNSTTPLLTSSPTAHRRQGSARPGLNATESTALLSPVSGLPRWRGLARSARSHSRSLQSTPAPAAARVRPSGENTTEVIAYEVSPVRDVISRRGLARPARSHSSTVPSSPLPTVARVCPSGANATRSPGRGGWVSAHRDGAAWAGWPDPTSSTVLSSPPAAVARVCPSGANATDSNKPAWPVSGSPRRRGLARSARSHSSTVPSKPALARVRPSGGERHRDHPIVEWPVSGSADAARRGTVSQIPQQHRRISRQCRPVSVRPGRTPLSAPHSGGRPAVDRGVAARPDPSDPKDAPSHRRRGRPGSARPGRTPST